MIRVLIAPSAYKGSFSPRQVAEAIAAGARDSGCPLDITLAPLADGGDGTIEALHCALGGRVHELPATGAMGAISPASWLELPDTAVVELASACGLAKLSGQPLSALAAHTAGLGQVLRACLLSGQENVVVAVGGSASTDGGTGALRALGARFFDDSGNELPLGGGALTRLAGCDLTALERLAGRNRIAVATDVKNTLLGPAGAAFVFAPQKGASSSQCCQLEDGLLKLASCLESATGREVRNVPGSGAAGGAAFGLSCALGARIISGFEWISASLRLPELVAGCDLIVTGEGQIDRQSLMGKSSGQLAALCAAYKRKLWILAARAEPGVNWQEFGVEKVIALCDAGSHADLSAVRAAACQAFSGLVPKD